MLKIRSFASNRRSGVAFGQMSPDKKKRGGLKQSFTDLNQGLNKHDCCWEVFSGVQPPLCSFHLPRASLNDTEGAESPSSLQGISWDRLDESQSPALSRIRAPTATVVTLHVFLFQHRNWLAAQPRLLLDIFFKC